MAWDKTLPANNSLLINTPQYIRDNWDALELMTDSALLITNAKVSPAAAIADTKLAQISTAGKVSGAALTNLAGIPAGAGNIPSANLGNAPDPFKSGDWIVSTVTTAHSGWTNVSATYSNKFMRINATPLTTGGADTHTTPSHILTTAEIPSHTHTANVWKDGVGTGDGTHFSGVCTTNQQNYVTDATGGGGGHTHDAATNVPAYVQVVIFQKD